MSAVKNYFKEQTQWRMVGVEHVEPADFYLSVWQTNRSAVPLLLCRGLLFLTSVGIVLASMVIYIQSGIYRFWFIYLTHWGLSANILATGFATLVSARCYFVGPISTKHQLPWYVKAYWVLYNIAAPVAFLITIFYWTILYEAGVEEEPNHGLDVAVHGLNTVVMFLLLLTSSLPSRLLHIYQPIVFGLAYFFFGLIYYLAGGVDNNGNRYVYAVVNWDTPGTTVAVGAITGLLLIILYLVTMGISLARDAIAVKLIQPSVRVYVNEELPLRRPTESNA